MTPAIQTLQDLGYWTLTVTALVCLLYLLRPRRREVTVPFAGLWQRALARAEAQRLGGRWRRLFSLLLSLLVTTLMMTALGEAPLGLRQWTEGPVTTPRSTVLLVDLSASMATQDGPEGSANRLQGAVDAVTTQIKRAGPGHSFLVLGASGVVETHCPWTDDRDLVLTALRNLRPHQGGVNLRRATRAAIDALRGRPEPEIVWVTDGGQRLPEMKLRVREVRVSGAKSRRGQPGFNLAIEHMTVRADADDPNTGTISVHVRNDGRQEVRAHVVLFASDSAQAPAEFDGAAHSAHQLLIKAGQSAWLKLPQTKLTSAHYAANVRPPPSHPSRDIAPWDDWGFAVHQQRRRLRVWRIGAPNLFLDAALLANDHILVERVKPDALTPQRLQSARTAGVAPDVVLVNQLQLTPPPPIPTLHFGLQSGEGDVIEEPGDLKVVRVDHPVVRGVTLHDTNVDTLRRIKTRPEQQVVVAERGGGAVIVANATAPRRVDVGLDLRETDLGGRYALPVLVTNALDWLVGRSPWLASSLVLGEPWALATPASQTPWRWRPPGQEPRVARTSGGQLVGVTEAHGIHVWRTSSGQSVLRATRLPSTERALTTTTPMDPWRISTGDAPQRSAPAHAPVWWWLIVFVASLLMVEWGLYQRRRVA